MFPGTQNSKQNYYRTFMYTHGLWLMISLIIDIQNWCVVPLVTSQHINVTLWCLCHYIQKSAASILAPYPWCLCLIASSLFLTVAANISLSFPMWLDMPCTRSIRCCQMSHHLCPLCMLLYILAEDIHINELSRLEYLSCVFTYSMLQECSLGNWKNSGSNHWLEWGD